MRRSRGSKWSSATARIFATSGRNLPESLTVVQQTVSDTQAGFAGKIASLSKPRRDVSIDMFGDVEGRMEGNERDSHSLLTSMDNLEGNHASLAKKHNKLASNHDGHREAEMVR